MSILRSYVHLFTRYRWPYAFGLSALLVTNVIYMAIPRVFGAAVDALDSGVATRAQMMGFAGTIVVLAVLQALARVGSRIYVLGVSRRVEYDLKELLHDRLVRLAPSFYNALSTGDLMSRMTNDVTLVRALGGPGILYFANAILIYVLGIIYMVTLSWQLTLIVLAPMPVMAWVVRGMVHRVRAYALGSRRALSDLNTTVQENLTGVHVVKAFALEDAQTRRFEERSNDYVGWALKESWTRAQMVPLVGLTGGLSYVGVLGFGGPMVASGAMSLGNLVAFVSYVAMMLFPTVAFGWILSLMQRGAAAMERLDEVINAPVTIDTPVDPETPGEARGTMSVRDLTFHYDAALRNYDSFFEEDAPTGSRRAALDEVSLEADAGQFIALVGRVGSGKSTLLKALPRLVEVPEGAVFVDGADVTRIDLDQLRARIAYVPQDDFLFSASVADNIGFGDPSADPGSIDRVARAAGLDPDSSGLADGFETQVGERGLNLSGGQRQRVALARALLRDARLLLLDNALSNVDTETERKILSGIRAHTDGRTVIAASNRITAIQDADSIYVMDRGAVVDMGTHQELASRPGLYSTMFEQQRLTARLERY